MATVKTCFGQNFGKNIILGLKCKSEHGLELIPVQHCLPARAFNVDKNSCDENALIQQKMNFRDQTFP